MEHGIVTDWNDMERIWQYIYSKDQLQTFSEEVIVHDDNIFMLYKFFQMHLHIIVAILSLIWLIWNSIHDLYFPCSILYYWQKLPLIHERIETRQQKYFSKLSVFQHYLFQSRQFLACKYTS